MLALPALKSNRASVGLAACLLGLALLAVSAAGAHPMELDAMSVAEHYRAAEPMREDPVALIRDMASSPDVAVFPIQVVGPIVVSEAPGMNLSNKLALGPGDASIAVIYPDIGEPYRSVFAQIIEGIESKAKAPVANYPVGANVDVGELKNTLRRQDTRVVIALGRQGLKIASMLDRNIGVVVAGVLSAPENEARDFPIINLTPDPALLFSRMKGLMPGTRRIFAVYDPRHNGWLMRLAKEAARSQGIELVLYEAQDLRNAMRAYQEILATVDSRQDALWLPQDSTTVEESTVLPMVLQESWNRNLAVFSSNFSHVKRGVLFSLYPNNVDLGRRLAGSAQGFLNTGDFAVRGMLPLREVLMAVNLRTAKHIGCNPGRQSQGFDLVFPEQ